MCRTQETGRPIVHLNPFRFQWFSPNQVTDLQDFSFWNVSEIDNDAGNYLEDKQDVNTSCDKVSVPFDNVQLPLDNPAGQIEADETAPVDEINHSDFLHNLSVSTESLLENFLLELESDLGFPMEESSLAAEVEQPAANTNVCNFPEVRQRLTSKISNVLISDDASGALVIQDDFRKQPSMKHVALKGAYTGRTCFERHDGTWETRQHSKLIYALQGPRSEDTEWTGRRITVLTDTYLTGVDGVPEDDADWVGFVGKLGYGLADTGCASCLMGRPFFEQYKKYLMEKYGRTVTVKSIAGGRCFRFGGCATTVANEVAEIPIGIAGCNGAIRVWIVETDTPFLIPEVVLKTLGTQLDLDGDSMVLKRLPGKPVVDLEESQSGHYFLCLTDFGAGTNGAEPCVSGDEIETFWGADLKRQAAELKELAEKRAPLVDEETKQARKRTQAYGRLGIDDNSVIIRILENAKDLADQALEPPFTHEEGVPGIMRSREKKIVERSLRPLRLKQKCDNLALCWDLGDRGLVIKNGGSLLLPSKAFGSRARQRDGLEVVKPFWRVLQADEGDSAREFLSLTHFQARLPGRTILEIPLDSTIWTSGEMDSFLRKYSNMEMILSKKGVSRNRACRVVTDSRELALALRANEDGIADHLQVQNLAHSL